MGGMRLARAGDIVAIALDRTKGGASKRRAIDAASCNLPNTVREPVLAKEDPQGIEEIVLGHVEHGGVLVERASAFRRFCLVCAPPVRPVPRFECELAVRMHGHQRRMLNIAWIDPSACASVT